MPIVSSHPDFELEIKAGPFERPSAITCPECGGELHRAGVGTISKCDCHIGHSCNGEVMAVAHLDGADDAGYGAFSE